MCINGTVQNIVLRKSITVNMFKFVVFRDRSTRLCHTEQNRTTGWRIVPRKLERNNNNEQELTLKTNIRLQCERVLKIRTSLVLYCHKFCICIKVMILNCIFMQREISFVFKKKAIFPIYYKKRESYTNFDNKLHVKPLFQ